MMHRRVPVIAERDVAKLQLRSHRSPHRKPYNRPEASADGERRGEPRSHRHAQDRPRCGLRRVGRRRPMGMGVAMDMIVTVRLGSHLKNVIL
jgi:hypothetical protein